MAVGHEWTKGDQKTNRETGREGRRKNERTTRLIDILLLLDVSRHPICFSPGVSAEEIVPGGEEE